MDGATLLLFSVKIPLKCINHMVCLGSVCAEHMGVFNRDVFEAGVAVELCGCLLGMDFCW